MLQVSLPKASPALLNQSRFSVSLFRDPSVHCTQQTIQAQLFTYPRDPTANLSLQCHWCLTTLRAKVSLFGRSLQEKKSPTLQFNSEIVGLVSKHLLTGCQGQTHCNFSPVCHELDFGFQFFVVRWPQQCTTIKAASAVHLSLACKMSTSSVPITESF